MSRTNRRGLRAYRRSPSRNARLRRRAGGDRAQQPLAGALSTPLQWPVCAHPLGQQHQVVLLAQHFAQPVSSARDLGHALALLRPAVRPTACRRARPGARTSRTSARVAQVLDVFAPLVQRRVALGSCAALPRDAGRCVRRGRCAPGRAPCSLPAERLRGQLPLRSRARARPASSSATCSRGDLVAERARARSACARARGLRAAPSRRDGGRACAGGAATSASSVLTITSASRAPARRAGRVAQDGVLAPARA